MSKITRLKKKKFFGLLDKSSKSLKRERKTSDISITIRKWANIFKIDKERKCEPSIFYPAKVTFKYKGQKLLATCKNSGNIVPTNCS